MIPTANHIIGVDGGGSTCRVAIATTDGDVIGRASGAAANPATSMNQAVSCLRETLSAARENAGLSEEELYKASVHMGLAGVINADIADTVAGAMRFGNIVVTDDRATNMVGALGGDDAFVAAHGTGSFVGRQRKGNRRFVGGWGIWLGDQASGAWLGRALLSRVLEWRDGLHPTSPLLEQTFAEYGDDPARIVLSVVDTEPSAYGKLAPRILKATEAGDIAGRAIVDAGVGYLEHALDVLGFQPGDPLCLTGGVGPHMAPFLSKNYSSNLIQPRGNALDGALRLAASMAGDAT